MFGPGSFDDRKLWLALGFVYKTLILGTLGSLFIFAPLKNGSRFPAAQRQEVAKVSVQEVVEMQGTVKVLWLNPKKLSSGQ